MVTGSGNTATHPDGPQSVRGQNGGYLVQGADGTFLKIQAIPNDEIHWYVREQYRATVFTQDEAAYTIAALGGTPRPIVAI